MNDFRSRVSLNGEWNFSLPGGIAEKRRVPGSYSCVGDSVYSRFFDWESPKGQRVHLCFEGIAYEGTVYLNGTAVGTMLPYSFYRFDVTALLHSGANELRVELKDINAVFGPSEGWKSYGGIIREVYLETTAPCFIGDVFFFSKRKEENRAAATVRIALDGPAEGTELSAVLLRHGHAAASCKPCPAGVETELSLLVENAELWSPDAPNLYTLQVKLTRGGDCLDVWEQRVGLKEFAVNGNRFTLNGEPIFLTGVCRHDLWTDEEGFTMTDSQIEQDMKLIKALGVNYVRLVHYPHDRRVLDAADRLGLLVSEEPGLWWSDLENEEITSRALKVLERVILRDRSHVSVAFWLSFNECVFTPEFLEASSSLARRLDPTRPISGANAMSITKTRELFGAHGFDFYTFHPYGTAPEHVGGGYGAEKSETLRSVCETLCDKPLIFTEWGGYYVHDNPHLFAAFCREMFAYSHSQPQQPALAGMCYWAWQDISEAQRGEPACVQGVLEEGLVTQDRRPKLNYSTFQLLLAELRCPPKEERYNFCPFGAGMPGKAYSPLCLPERNTALQETAWEEAIKASLPMPEMFYKKSRRLSHGPALKNPVDSLGCLTAWLPAGRPLVVSSYTGPIDIPVNQSAQSLWFIGQCTLGRGYPISGERGEAVGCYRLTYADGTAETIPLRNGVETATVLGLHGPSAIEPRASAAGRAFTFSYDKNWEVYHTGLLCVSANPALSLQKITAEVTDSRYSLLLYGITLEGR